MYKGTSSRPGTIRCPPERKCEAEERGANEQRGGGTDRGEHPAEQRTARRTGVLPGVQRREDPRSIVIPRATRHGELDRDRRGQPVDERAAADNDEKDR